MTRKRVKIKLVLKSYMKENLRSTRTTYTRSYKDYKICI